MLHFETLLISENEACISSSSSILLFLLWECMFGLKPTYRQMTLYILGIQVPSNSYLARQILINMPAWVRNHPQLLSIIETTVGWYGGMIVSLCSRRVFFVYFYFYFTHFRMFYLAAVPQTDDSIPCLTKGWRCFLDQRRQKSRKRIRHARACNVRQFGQGVHLDQHPGIPVGRLMKCICFVCMFFFCKGSYKLDGMMKGVCGL